MSMLDRRLQVLIDAARRAAWERLHSAPRIPPIELAELKALVDEARSGAR